MDNIPQGNAPTSSRGPQWPAAQEFALAHQRELTFLGLFLAGCLTGYVLGVRGGRAPLAGENVIEASMISHQAEAKPHHAVEPAPAAKKALGKSEKSKKDKKH